MPAGGQRATVPRPVRHASEPMYADAGAFEPDAAVPIPVCLACPHDAAARRRHGTGTQSRFRKYLLGGCECVHTILRECV